ncbi:hypothetical protein F0562_025385 [Nyssa sinensis]|uniref:Uncharacterized protein n=1 Tax=Nyssa sinensis TaxID=561372 RepID=A0A5J5BI43_9ASTE|nr:hypothetical protein F0562_025385 [Nyssa sinensis]
MTKDCDVMHTFVLDVPKNLGLSNDIPEPNVTTDINLVEELDITFKVDQELGEPSFAQVLTLVRLWCLLFNFLDNSSLSLIIMCFVLSVQDAQETDVLEGVVQEAKISRPDKFGFVTSLSHVLVDHQPSSLSIYDPDLFIPFMEVVHKVPTSSTINVETPDLQDPSAQHIFLLSRDVSPDYLVDLMETVEVFECDGLVLAWLHEYWERLGQVPCHISCVRELYQLEGEHVRLREQVASLEHQIAKLKSCDMDVMELSLNKEGSRRSTLLDLV